MAPGATVDIPCAFTLADDTAPVEFELSELFSLTNDVLARTYDLAAIQPVEPEE